MITARHNLYHMWSRPCRKHRQTHGLQEVEDCERPLQTCYYARRSGGDDAAEDEKSDKHRATGTIMSLVGKMYERCAHLQKLRRGRSERQTRLDAEGGHELYGGAPDRGRNTSDEAHRVRVYKSVSDIRQFNASTTYSRRATKPDFASEANCTCTSRNRARPTSVRQRRARLVRRR